VKKVIFVTFFLITGTSLASFSNSVKASVDLPKLNNTFSGNSVFSPMIIGSGLNYVREEDGEVNVSPSLSWMMKYEIGKFLTLKTNVESIFTKNKEEANAYISSNSDFYIGVKTSRELEVSLKVGAHYSNNGKSSVSYGVEFEHNSKLLKRLNVSTLYLGLENIPNLGRGKRRIYSGVRFNL
jgi:hypothetical protein